MSNPNQTGASFPEPTSFNGPDVDMPSVEDRDDNHACDHCADTGALTVVDPDGLRFCNDTCATNYERDRIIATADVLAFDEVRRG